MEANGAQKTVNAKDPWTESQMPGFYCWACHKKCTIFKCSTCFRSFHYKCLPTSQPYLNIDDLFVCPVCVSLKKTEKLFTGKEVILESLQHVKKKIEQLKEVCVPNSSVDKCLTGNSISLDVVLHRIDNRLYKSLDAFLVDIECIYHNCFICDGENGETTKSAKNLLNICKLTVESISACSECYENSRSNQNEWSTIACKTPHLILFAKLNRLYDFGPVSKGFTHWPAKLTKVHDNDQTIKVIFFGDSKFTDIPAHDCYLYSTTAAIPSQSTVNPEDIRSMKKEVEFYIKNVKAKFGKRYSIVTNLPLTSFDPRRLDEHMKTVYRNDEIGTIEGLDDINNLANNSAENQPIKGTEIHNDRSPDTPVVPTKRARFSSLNRSDDTHFDAERILYSSLENDDLDQLSSPLNQRIDMKFLEQTNDFISTKNRIIENLINKLKTVKKAQVECKKKNQQLILERDKLIADAANTPDFIKEIAELNKSHAKAIAEINKAHDQKVQELKMEYDAVIARKEREITEQKSEIQALNGGKLKIEEEMKVKYGKIAENFIRDKKKTMSWKSGGN